MSAVTIYSDGSFSPITWYGGWGGVILREKHYPIKLLGGEFGLEGVDNVLRMEMLAIVKCLEHLTGNSKVLLYTDSLIVKTAMTEWMPRWKSNGWKNGYGQSILNRDLWDALDHQSNFVHKVIYIWVRGHSGNKYNNMADRLATRGRRRAEKQQNKRR